MWVVLKGLKWDAHVLMFRRFGYPGHELEIPAKNGIRCRSELSMGKRFTSVIMSTGQKSLRSLSHTGCRAFSVPAGFASRLDRTVTSLQTFRSVSFEYRNIWVQSYANEERNGSSNVDPLVWPVGMLRPQPCQLKTLTGASSQQPSL